MRPSRLRPRADRARLRRDRLRRARRNRPNRAPSDRTTLRRRRGVCRDARGRDDNTAHLVADSRQAARQQWIEVFSRDRADLGPAHAARLAADEAAKYATYRPLDRAFADLRAAWTQESDLRNRLVITRYLVDTYVPYDAASAQRLRDHKQVAAELADMLKETTHAVNRRLREPAIRALPPGRLSDEHARWEHARRQAQRAAHERRNRPSLPYPNPPYARPERGRGIGR